MSYSESESDFNFAINSVSDFNSESESKSESDFSSVFMTMFKLVKYNYLINVFLTLSQLVA